MHILYLHIIHLYRKVHFSYVYNLTNFQIVRAVYTVLTQVKNPNITSTKMYPSHSLPVTIPLLLKVTALLRKQQSCFTWLFLLYSWSHARCTALHLAFLTQHHTKFIPLWYHNLFFPFYYLWVWICC